MAIKRGTILTNLQTRLSGILSTAGYHSNLGNKVYLNKMTDWQDSELPGVAIREIENLVIDSPSGFTDQELTVELEIQAKDASTAASYMRNYIYDILKAIGTDPTFSGNAIYTYYIRDRIVYTQEAKVITGAVVEIKIQYRTSLWGE